MSAAAKASGYTPPLGHAALTPLYDAAVALTTRETIWRRALVDEIKTGARRSIIDVGSGTGSLAALLRKASPETRYLGVDPDGEAVRRARAKAARTGAEFRVGYFPESAGDQAADVIVSSLVLHQVPLAEKKRIIDAAYSHLGPGGRFLVADYGLQNSPLARFLFRATVQALDGREDTQPNADGVVPELMRDAGFDDIEEKLRLPTLTGLIYIHAARKPAS
ncbi:MAG: class I SAM-dependent methyltransferase [Pseudomonadota bacterium]